MEEWKDIQGYEGLYQVSSLGNVRSLDRSRVLPNGRIRSDRGVVLNNIVGNKGYRYVSLSSNGYFKRFSVHRLVAIHFIENKENKPEVNHIDGDKSNNAVSNLEWNTGLENIRHAFLTGLIVRMPEQYDRMRVAVYSPELEMSFKSLSCAVKYCRVNGFDKITDAKISECSAGVRKSIYGLTWKRINNDSIHA